MDDPEHEDDAILADHVEHDAIVADAKSVERVRGPADRLHSLSSDAAGLGDIHREPFEGFANPSARCSRHLLVDARGRRRKANLVRFSQPSSVSVFVRPLR